jgi:hypothetical protein
VSTNTTKSKPAEPTARRIHALTASIAKSCNHRNGIRPSAAMRRELREICLDTVAYLTERIASVETACAPSKAASDMSKIENEINTLKSVQDKGEPEYQRLAGLERMLSDLSSKVEIERQRGTTGDELLNDEIAGFQQQLAVALSINYCGDILDRAVKAVQPFCESQPPLQFARALPAVVGASAPFNQVYSPRLSGVENAQAVIALIEKTLGQ